VYLNVTNKKSKLHFYGVSPANFRCRQEPPFSSKLGIQDEPMQRKSTIIQMSVDKDIKEGKLKKC